MDELDNESVDSWLKRNASQRKALRSMLNVLKNNELPEFHAEVDQDKSNATKNKIMTKITQLFKKLGVLTLILWMAGSLNVMAQNKDFVPGKVRVKIKPNQVEMVAKGMKKAPAAGQLKIGLSSFDKISAKFAATKMDRVFPHAGKNEAKHIKHGLHLWYEIDVENEADIQVVAREYGSNEYVDWAEPISVKSVNYSGVEEVSAPSRAIMEATTNDPYLVDQWHLSNDGSLNGSVAGSDINAFRAWDINTGTSNVVVAVVDGGIDTAHEDLRDNMWVNEAELNGEPGVDDDFNGYIDDVYGYNFADNQGTITAHDHGTHVAGTVAATSNNGKGVAGVAGGSGNGDGVRLISAQVFSNSNSGNFASAIVYGADNGAVISQNSWGYQTAGQYEQAVLDAIDYFIEEAGNYPGSPMKGGVVLFAAGNNGRDQMHYPSYYDKTIAIASTGSDYKKAPYSNYGAWVDLTTTGGNVYQGSKSQVLSTLPGNRYGYMQGTSMATPHASGIAALVVSEYGGNGFTNEDLKKRLFTAVKELDSFNPEYAGLLGYGFMDAALALAINDNQAPATVTDLTLLGASQDFATVHFTVPADAGDGTPQLFRLYWSKDPAMGNKKEMLIQNEFRSVGDIIEVNVEGLDFETTYYFAVVAEDRWGNISGLSNIVEGTTNRGPDISTDIASFTSSIDASVSMNATDMIKVQNNDTGILTWEAEPRQTTSFASTTMAELPAQGTIKSVTQMEVGQQMIDLVEQFATKDAAPNAWEASEKTYFSRFPSYVIGDLDTTMTNSSATKFVVDDPEGFNLTYVSALLQLDKEDGPAVMEIYKGEEIRKENLIYSDNRFSPSKENDIKYYAINTTEQLFFESGETFWVVFHAPSGNLYPLGMGAETSPEYSDNCLMSFDLGETWVPLAGAIENEYFAWAVTVASKTEPLHKYMTLSPNEGRIPGIGEENMDVAIDASQLINGTYRSNVVIKSNDEDTPLHRVAATVNVTGHKPVLSTNNILDFGSVFNGLSATKEMTIINSGYGRFRTKTVTSSNPAFTVNSSVYSLNVAARSESTMSLTYTPSGVGNENAVITLTSYNGDVHKFNVFGVGTAPAEISVEPLVIDFNDVQVGESVQATLTITNTGQYPLQYGFPAFADDLSHIENLPANVQRFPYAMETTPYNGYVFNDISTTGTEVTDFFVKNSGAEFLNVDLGFDFPFFGESVNNLFITKRGTLTLGQDGNFNATSQFHGSSMPNGYIAAIMKEWALSIGGSIHYKRELGKFIVQYTNVRHANDRDTVAITFQIEIYSNGDIKLIYDKFDGLASYQLNSLYSAIENATKNDGVLVNSSYNKVSLPMAPQQIVHIHSPGIGLIKDVAEAAGMIQPGESMDLVLTVDGDKLIEGTHKEYIAVLSNDPFNSSEAIEVNIDVVGGGSSEVLLSETEVNFGDVFQQANVNGTIGLKNDGSRQLEITNIAFTNGQLTFGEDTSVVVEPNQTFYVNYTLDTQNLGPVADTLVFTDSEGNTYEVSFTGQIVDAPGIEVVETAYTETIDPDQQVTRAFQVTNTGKATLEYAIAASEHITIQESAATTTAVEDFTYVYRSTYDDTMKPTFQWIKLTEEDKVTFRLEEGIVWEQLELPFEFEFYQQNYNKVWMSSMGALSFEEEIDVTYAPFTPPSVPKEDTFNNFIAPYFAAGGPNINLPEEKWGRYMKVFEDKVVFEWRGYNNLFGIGGEFSIQAILYKSGKIKYQYKHDPNVPVRAFYGLIGMENQTGTDGIQIAYYQEYLANEVAIDIYPAKKETLAPGESRNYDLNFSAVGSNAGVYNESLKVINNTPLTPEIEVPVELTVTGEAAMAFIPETLDLGEKMVVPDAAYQYFVSFTNTGKKTMNVNNLRLEDATTAVVEHLVYNFRWGWQWTALGSTDTFTVEPGFESKEFRITITPQEANANYTNKLLADTDFGTTEEMPILADFKLPPVFTVNDEAVYHMAYNNDVYAHTLNLENLEGESPLKYSIGMSYPRENAAPAANPANTGVNATLLRTKLDVNEALNAAPANTAFATVLAHDDATEAYTSVGYNGITEFMGSTKFVAPETGFNLSHVQTWYVPGAWLNSDIKVEIRVGDYVENAEVLYQETINYTISTPDSDGSLLTLELSEVVELLPYEKFYVVITYPLGANYPQGMVKLDAPKSETFKYYASGFWYDLNASFAEDGFMMRAAETTKAGRNWLNVAGAIEGEVVVGGTLDLNVELHPDKTTVPFNFATLSIDTNDPFNSSVTIPVTLEINQAPELVKEELYTVNENETLSLNLATTDYEGDAVVSAAYLGADQNVSLSMDNGVVIFTYTPGYEDSGEHTFDIVIADENGVERTETLVVNVIDVNRDPVAAAMDKQIVDLYTEVFELNLNDVISDPDGDVLSFEVAAYDATVASVTINGTSIIANPLQVGTTMITVKGLDQRGGEVALTFELEVVNGNQEPMAKAIENQWVDLYTEIFTLGFNEVFNDPEGEVMTFEAYASEADIVDVAFDQTGITVTPLQLGTTTITLTASDARDGQVAVSFELEVININEAPVITPVSDVTLNLYTDSFELFYNDVFADPEGEALTFNGFAENNGTVDLFFKDGSMLIKPLKLGQTTITLQGMDDRDGEATTTFQVTVVGNITNSNMLNESWNVHPNPVNDIMYIKMYNPVMEKMHINFYNALGMLIKSAQSDGSDGTIEISVSDLTPGVYYVEMVTANAKSVKKIVKN